MITLSGDNSFLINRKLHQLVQEFAANNGDLAVQQIDCSETEQGVIREALMSLPFLSSKRMVILRDFAGNSSLMQGWPELSEQIPETTTVVIEAINIDKRLSIYKFLKDKTDFQEYLTLSRPDLIKWLIHEAGQHDTELSRDNAEHLVNRVGANQELLANELTKLMLSDTKISREYIDQMTDQSPQSNIFDLLEAAFSSQPGHLIKLYAEQRQLKVEPQQIMSMLTWQLHILTVIKAAGNQSANEIAKTAKISPFVVRKNQAIARQLPQQQLDQLVSRLLELDIKSKTENINLDDALQYFLLTTDI